MTLLNVNLFYGYAISYSWGTVEVPEDVIHRYYPFRLKWVLGGGRK